MTKSLMSMDQLVKAANQRITELKIKPSHHKARSKITSRTVRYYLQNGYILEAIRVSGQIRFSEEHLQAIIRVKNLQAKGHFLKDITHDHKSKRDTVEQIVGFKAITVVGTKNPQPVLWALKVGKDLTLSGSGTTPSNEELAVLKPFIQIWQQNSSLKQSKR